MKEADKTKIGRFTWDLILIAFVIIIVVIKKVWFSNLSYKAGLAGDPFHELDLMLVSLLLFVILGVVFLAALFRLIKGIRDIYKTKSSDWPKITFLIIPFILFPVFFIGPGEAGFLQGYEKWVQKEVDIASIQKWLKSLDMAYSGKRYFEAKDFPQGMPEAMTKLKLQYIYFSEFNEDNRSVELEWGCAFEHWGIRIGLPGVETPEEGCIEIHEGFWEYRRPIQPGVYIFSRG